MVIRQSGAAEKEIGLLKKRQVLMVAFGRE
jgi:hypothetical protein